MNRRTRLRLHLLKVAERAARRYPTDTERFLGMKRPGSPILFLTCIAAIAFTAYNGHHATSKVQSAARKQTADLRTAQIRQCRRQQNRLLARDNLQDARAFLGYSDTIRREQALARDPAVPARPTHEQTVVQARKLRATAMFLPRGDCTRAIDHPRTYHAPPPRRMTRALARRVIKHPGIHVSGIPVP